MTRRPRLGAALPRRPRLPPRLGARRARPLPVRRQRDRDLRAVRLGPRHGHSPAGDRPAARHQRRRAPAGRRARVVVRRLRRRRVRGVAAPAVGRRPGRAGAAGGPGGLPGRPGDRPGRHGGGLLLRRRAPRRTSCATAPRRSCTGTRRTPTWPGCRATSGWWRSSTASTATAGTRRCGWSTSPERPWPTCGTATAWGCRCSASHRCRATRGCSRCTSGPAVRCRSCGTRPPASRCELGLDGLPGDLTADWYPDGRRVLVHAEHRGPLHAAPARPGHRRAHPVLPTPPGTVTGATAPARTGRSSTPGRQRRRADRRALHVR